MPLGSNKWWLDFAPVPIRSTREWSHALCLQQETEFCWVRMVMSCDCSFVQQKGRKHFYVSALLLQCFTTLQRLLMTVLPKSRKFVNPRAPQLVNLWVACTSAHCGDAVNKVLLTCLIALFLLLNIKFLLNIFVAKFVLTLATTYCLKLTERLS